MHLHTRLFTVVWTFKRVDLGLLAHLHATFVLKQEAGDIAELNTAEWGKKGKMLKCRSLRSVTLKVAALSNVTNCSNVGH